MHDLELGSLDEKGFSTPSHERSSVQRTPHHSSASEYTAASAIDPSHDVDGYEDRDSAKHFSTNHQGEKKVAAGGAGEKQRGENSSSDTSFTYEYVSAALRALSTHDEHTTSSHSQQTLTIEKVYLRNLDYLRNKIRAHAFIFDAAKSGVCGGAFQDLLAQDRLEEIKRDLHEYTTALKDWHFWSSQATHSDRTAFHRSGWATASASTPRDLAILALAQHTCSPSLLAPVLATMHARYLHANFHSASFSEAAARETEGRRARREDVARFVKRLATALAAGLALVVPVLVMTLRPGKACSLVVASVSTLAVAVVLAASWAESKDIVGATAAYAAVLVVFVGSTD